MTGLTGPRGLPGIAGTNSETAPAAVAPYVVKSAIERDFRGRITSVVDQLSDGSSRTRTVTFDRVGRPASLEVTGV